MGSLKSSCTSLQLYPSLFDSIVKAISFSEFLLEENYPSETDKSSRYKFAV